MRWDIPHASVPIRSTTLEKTSNRETKQILPSLLSKHSAAGLEQDMASYPENGTEKGDSEFILDTGASDHMVKDSTLLLNEKEVSRSIALGNGERVTAKLCGDIEFTGKITCGRDSYSSRTVLKICCLSQNAKKT